MNFGPPTPDPQQDLVAAHAALKGDVKELFALIGETDTTEDGKVFHPTTISCCRALDAIKLEALMNRISDQLEPTP